MVCSAVLFLVIGGVLTTCDGLGTPHMKAGLDYYEPVHHQALRYPRSVSSPQLHFTAFNKTFSAQLTPHTDVFTPNAQFLFNGERVEPHTLYKGHLEGESDSTVIGHVVDGVFDGVIRIKNKEFHVERTAKLFPTVQPFPAVIYRSEDAHTGRGASCGAKSEILDRLQAIQAKARPTKEDPQRYGSDRFVRDTTASGNMFCPMLVAGDHLFLEAIGGGNPQTAMSELVTIMTSVQGIFRLTDFDNNGRSDGIVPLIARVQVMDGTAPDYRFSSANIGVEDYLDLWSQIDHQQFCLALLLTYRDFSNGVLGLAWVAQPPGGNRGGICERRVTLNIGPRFLNTAIVTMLNYGQRQARSVTVVTTAHELGHNFGSPHDPGTPECSPGFLRGGNYIMFPSATDGAQANNNRFSNCSKSSILPVLQSTRSMCFTADGSFCGNGLIEPEEECDCGEMCDLDPCCTQECLLTPGSQCSPSQSCCNDTCQFRGSEYQCRGQTECGMSVNCNGFSAICPEPDPISEGLTLCNNNMNFCVDGVCSGSVCVQEALPDCQCSEESQRCHVCCIFQGQCMSSFDIESIPNMERESGRSCNNFTGYCDSAGQCRIVDNEGTLNDLLDLFTLDTLNIIAAWLAANWYIPVGVVVGLAILVILLQVTYRRRKPIRKRLQAARNTLRRGEARSVSEAQTGGVGGANRERRRGQNNRRISPREAMVRLSTFFPTAESSVVQRVIQSAKSESKAVKKMIDKGYPLKKVPIPGT